MTALSDDRREALQEIINIGFGRSMAALADLLGVHIQLSVPDISTIEGSQIFDFILASLNGTEEVSLVRQTFRGDFFGEAVLALSGRAGRELVVMLSEDSGFAPALEMGQLELEALLEVGNVVVGACLGQFAELLETSLSFNPPVVLMDSIHSLQTREVLSARPGEALLIRTTFRVNERAVTGYLLIFLPADCLEWVYREVDRFLQRVLA